MRKHFDGRPDRDGRPGKSARRAPDDPPPQAEMPPALREELDDGVLNARLWADGTAINGSSRFYRFTAHMAYLKFDLTDLGSFATHFGTTTGQSKALAGRP